MAGFDLGLFAPSTAPIGGTKSNVPQSALGAISKATTLQDENPFDSITQPLRRRKRRKVAEELAKQGLEPGTQEYFKTFRDKLIEFGDMEGAETVEAKRVEYEQRDIKNQQTESLIANRESLITDRKEDNERADKDVESKILKREADIEAKQAQLEDVDKRLEIMQQNADSQATRVQLEGLRTTIAQQQSVLDADLKRARTERLNLENEFLKENGSLPSRARLADMAKQSNAKVSDAVSLIDQLDQNLKDAAESGGNILPGDEVSGIEGFLKAAFGGIIRQATGGKIDVGTQAVTQRQSYEYLGSLLVPVLLNEKKVTDQDRQRVDRIVGRLKAATDNKQARAELANLRQFIGELPDKDPDDDEDTSTESEVSEDRESELMGKYNIGN